MIRFQLFRWHILLRPSLITLDKQLNAQQEEDMSLFCKDKNDLLNFFAFSDSSQCSSHFELFSSYLYLSVVVPLSA